MELIAEGLQKAYGSKVALAHVSLRARPGVLALLGPNGSGKTTLLRILATVATPDAGTLSFGNRGYRDDPRPIRRVLGYLPQDVELPEHLTPLALLRYMASLKGVPEQPQTDALLDALGLTTLARRPVRSMSEGQVKRVAVAQALLGAPRLLILDEPTAGLDPQERDRVLRATTRPREGRVVILSSHVPSEVESVADQVLVLGRGEALYAGSVDGLRRQATGAVWEVRAPAAAVDRWLEMCLVSRITRQGEEVRLRVLGALPAGAAGEPVAPSLEDAYLLLLQERKVKV